MDLCLCISEMHLGVCCFLTLQEKKALPDIVGYIQMQNSEQWERILKSSLQEFVTGALSKENDDCEITNHYKRMQRDQNPTNGFLSVQAN